MSPADLKTFTADGKAQLRRILERAVACHARCGNRQHHDAHGFCADCWAMLPPQLRAPMEHAPTLRAVTEATTWVRGLLAEGAHE